MSNSINRQAVIDTVVFECGEWQGLAYTIVKELNKLPSEEPEWIPCNKMMPKEREWIGTKEFGTTISDEVYVTFEASDGQRFVDHISFQNGNLSPMDKKRMDIIYKGAKPIAWMPLPEPWKGGREE